MIYNPADTLSYGAVLMRTLVVIMMLDEERNPAMNIQLYSAWLKEIQLSSIDPTSHEPLRITMQLVFGDMAFSRT